MTERWDDRYAKFHREVVKRDGHKCQFPGCKSRKKIEVHHITPWSVNIATRYDISNGICLCIKHHNHVRNKEALYADLFRTIARKNSKK